MQSSSNNSICEYIKYVQFGSSNYALYHQIQFSFIVYFYLKYTINLMANSMEIKIFNGCIKYRVLPLKLD